MIGYGRGADAPARRAALERAGCALVFIDGAPLPAGQPALDMALGACLPGDILVAERIEALGRSLYEMEALLLALRDRGAALKILSGPGAAIDTSGDAAYTQLIYTLFAALAEAGRAFTSENTKTGMRAARERGISIGRPAKLSAPDLRKARRLIEAEGVPRIEVAKRFGVHPATLRRALREEGKTEG